MVTYMLSQGDAGWVLCDDEGRVSVLAGTGEAMLGADNVMRENGDPISGSVECGTRRRRADVLVQTTVTRAFSSCR